MLRNKPSRQKGQDPRTLPTYTIPEVGQMLAIDSYTLQSWYSGHDPLLKPSAYYSRASGIALLSFWDVEEVYKVHLLRTKFQKSMQYLRRAMVDARHTTKSEHPLLTHKMIVFENLAWDKPARGNRARQMVPLGAGQTSLYIPEVVETWGKRIITGKQLFPWRHAAKDDVSRPVSISPQVMSGRLVLGDHPKAAIDDRVKTGHRETA